MKGVFLPPSTAEFVLPYHSSVFSISGVSSATLGSLGLEYLLRMNQKNILSLERLNQNKTKKKIGETQLARCNLSPTHGGDPFLKQDVILHAR
jgi:hypothetical protein